MDIKALLAKLPTLAGIAPPGTEKLLEILSANPKLTLCCSLVVVGGILYRYFTNQRYPAPWMDRRKLETTLTKKELLETVFKEDRASNENGEEWDVIVIGSGLSGLATANFLARSGLSVLVLEKHYVAGGCTHIWEDAGREFDVGVHYLGAGTGDPAETTGATLQFLTDNKLKWQKMDDNFDTVVLNDGTGKTESYKMCARKDRSRPWDTFEEMLKERFPDEHGAIDQFMIDLDASKKGSLALGMYKILPIPLLNFLMKFGLHDKLFKNWQLTTSARDYLDSITTNKKLQCVLNYCFGDYGTQPRKAPMWMAMTLINHFKDGGIYPVGGSSEITKAISEPLVARGGKVLVRANVTDICIQNGTAVGVMVQPTFIGSDGEEVFVGAKHVVSTISVWHTNNIIQNPSLKIPIDHLTPGPGCMYIFFGMNEDCPPVPSRNWWCYNTKENYDYDDLIDSYMDLDMADYIEAPAPLMFVSFPSAKDPEYAARNPGKGPTGVIITIAKWDWFVEMAPDHEQRWGVTNKKDRMKRPKEYTDIRDRLGRQILEQAQEYIPEVQFLEHVNYLKVGTPMTQRHYLNCVEGSIYSADHDLSRFKPENLMKSRPETPVQNLTQGGQDILTCGVSTTITTAMLAAGHVLGRKLLLEAGTLKTARNLIPEADDIDQLKEQVKDQVKDHVKDLILDDHQEDLQEDLPEDLQEDLPEDLQEE